MVDISPDAHGGPAGLLRNVVRQPWFTSISLFLADLALVSLAYSFSRAIRVNQALIMSPAYLMQVAVFFFCILVSVALIGGYKARRTFHLAHFAAEFILAVVLGAAIGAFIIFVFSQPGL